MQISSSSTYPSLQAQVTTLPKKDAQTLDETTLQSDKELGALNKEDEESQETSKTIKSDNELSTSEQQQVSELRQIDSQVRAHEAAHIAAGGSAISGGASFTYQKGPDGQLYAIGGEVPISSAGASSPEAEIAIAKDMQAAALAPANPSPQDLKVAASAAQMEAQARQALNLEKSEEQKEKEIRTYSNNQNEIYEDETSQNINLSA